MPKKQSKPYPGWEAHACGQCRYFWPSPSWSEASPNAWGLCRPDPRSTRVDASCDEQAPACRYFRPGKPKKRRVATTAADLAEHSRQLRQEALRQLGIWLKGNG